ncbi:type I-E CRISPR-associated protein Cas6/Cse3/CasE [Kitasatospora sp. NBC_01287]|uniref:type I-E CRISPR-associated protein Cas6/Cse3/CasE n=1 Tax=Kitasatospora sp. NBC_01287 TaxID=2903573 RepID=UPI002259A6D6|nr:type I-E CRISPR-associated protein Cas6/Cse3/CasE [Kitasatospora sp. NBC_01287]MCX4750592.1 type I-E CRISPR-associated protein Cas6/Cse3/CasE [Kitasatospora sp. NBC_01287]
MNLWLTRILPDQRHRDARKDLNAAVDLHHRLMALFPDHIGDQARQHLGVLFRVEDAPAGTQILLQSTQPPDLTRLPTGYGTAATKPLTPLLDALRADLTIRYRIAANAIRKPGRTTRELYNLGPVVPLNGAAAEEWWIRQAENSGLKVITVHSTPLDAARGTRRQDHNRIKHARTQFEGTALITDPDQLRTRLTDGIGKGKAYGCGLLSIAPARQP